MSSDELILHAKALPREKRKAVIKSIKERDLHKHLKRLLERIDPESYIEITHGPNEEGRDLVMIRKDPVFQESVVAIIVKTGDIRGTTAGKVDEIKSQIEQSFSSKVRLKGVAKALSISEAWIVIAGELSRNAHRRIEYEIRGYSIKIFDINWLIDTFTKFFPEIFFDPEVTDFLQSQIVQYETSDLVLTTDKPLSEWFVEPWVSPIEIPTKFSEEELALIISKDKFPFSALHKIIKPGIRVILAGDPGVGKTVALRKLALDILKRAQQEALKGTGKIEVDIPILISANKFLEFDDVETFLKAVIPEKTADRFKIYTILIDGLDEILDVDQREILLTKADHFAKQLNCGVIVSTRKIDLVKSAPQGFDKYELLPFEFGQALELFERLVSDQEVLNALREGLERIKYQIPMHPLSLLLLIKIAEDNKEIPASITELYDQFIDMALGRYDSQKGIRVLFEYLVKKRFLAQLAYEEFLTKGRLEITRGEFKNFLEYFAGVYGWEADKLKLFTTEVERAGILNIRNEVSFRHRSFLDYFGAFYIYDSREKFDNLADLLADIYFDASWGDVAFFYVGLKRETSAEILRRIFESEKCDFVACVDKFMVGRLLQAGWHSVRAVRLEGIKNGMHFAPVIKNKFLSLSEKAGRKIPRIFADFFLLMLAELSFRSGFLADEVRTFITEILEQDQIKYENLYMATAGLWALRPFCDKEEVDGFLTEMSSILSRIPDCNFQQKATILLMLEAIERKMKLPKRQLKKKVARLARRHPEAFRGILPRK